MSTGSEIIASDSLEILTNEVQLGMLEQLIPNRDFMAGFLAFAQTSRRSYQLVHDMSLWRQVAKHWLFDENHFETLSPSLLAKILHMLIKCGQAKLIDLMDPNYEDYYHTFGKALLIAAKADDLTSIKGLCQFLAQYNFTYYQGEALKMICQSGSYEAAEFLLEAIFAKSNAHGRENSICSAYENAIENAHFPSATLLFRHPFCVPVTSLFAFVGQQLVKSARLQFAAHQTPSHSEQVDMQSVESALALLSIQDETEAKKPAKREPS